MSGIINLGYADVHRIPGRVQDGKGDYRPENTSPMLAIERVDGDCGSGDGVTAGAWAFRAARSAAPRWSPSAPMECVRPGRGPRADRRPRPGSRRRVAPWLRQRVRP